MENLLSIAAAVILILVSIIGYFLMNLHSRFEDHLRISAQADVEFGKLQVKQEELCERVEKVEGKLDELGTKVDNLPFRVVELLKGMK